LQELLAINKELQTRESEQQAENYVPNGKVEEFIKLVGSNKSFVNLLVAGNGVGKSAAGAMIVRAICYGKPNDWFNHPLFVNYPYMKRGRIISDPTTLKEKVVPELKKWFPSNRYNVKYETYKEGKSYEAKWITDTGFEINLMSNEQEPKEFESVDLGFCWFDEPSKKAIYMGTVARMRRGGTIFWTMTPLAYSAWIKDELYDKRDGIMIDYVTADVSDNCIEHGVRGILEHKNIERMLSQYPEAEKEARAHGKFGHLIGLVHKGFEPKIHVIEPFTIDNNYSVYMALDTHPRVPDACLWMAVNEKNQKYIIDELSFTGTDAEIAAKIKQKETSWNVQKRLIDPSGFIDDKRTNERSYADRLRALGLNFLAGSKNLLEGIRKTDDAFSYQVKEGQMIVSPEIFIFSNNINLIHELLNYVWDEYVGKGADEKDPKARPKDKDDHFVEDLHRLLLANFTYIRPELQKKRKNLLPKKYKPRKML